MTESPDSNPLVGQTLGKKFLVQRVIGAGGMATVYEAEHLLTKRVGALKLLHPSWASVGHVAERFLREASAAGRIGNPHIVETIDAGELPSGEPYIFMELLSGSPLRELLKKRGRLGFERARELLAQAAEGLAAAHGAGIIHRDIKPDNLFVRDEEPPFLKILDFGISKFAEHDAAKRLTAQGSALGTPHYMAPEQVVNKPEIDARVDVYALGVVLYECVTGKVPFDAASLSALGVKIFEGDYAPASSLARDVPAGLDALVARAMARDPAERFASMIEFRNALLALDASVALPLGPTSPSLEPATGESELAPTPAPAPTPVAKPKPRAWIALALVAALGGLGVALGRDRETAEPSERETPSVAPALPVLTAEPPEPASAQTAQPPTPSASAIPRALSKPRPAKSAAPRSSAAIDGLLERNPFAD